MPVTRNMTLRSKAGEETIADNVGDQDTATTFSNNASTSGCMGGAKSKEGREQPALSQKILGHRDKNQDNINAGVGFKNWPDSRFPVIRKTARVKPTAEKLSQQRTMAIVYYPGEPIGFRFRLRSIGVVETWSTLLKTSGILNYPLTDSMRMNGYIKKQSSGDTFLIFATLSKFTLLWPVKDYFSVNVLI